MTLDFAQVAAFGAIQYGTAASGTDTMSGKELQNSGGALSSKDVIKSLISGGGDDDPDDRKWKGILAEFKLQLLLAH